MGYSEISWSMERIEKEISKVLPSGVKIHDIVYRPYDMGIFGAKGFSFGLITDDGKRGAGKNFSCVPTDSEVRLAVREMLSVINGKEEKL